MKTKFLIKVIFTVLTCMVYSTSFSQDLQEALKLGKGQQFEEADEIYKKLISQPATNNDVYFYYGENTIKKYLADTFAFSKKEIIAESSKIFSKGASLDSTNALNYVGLGMVELLKSGDTTKADKYLNRANALIPVKIKKATPRDAVLLTKLGLAYLYGKNKRYQKALVLIERAKQITLYKDTEVYIAAGDAYIGMNDGSKAIEMYNKALYLDPKSTTAQIKIGYIYLSARNLNESRRYFEDAKQTDSTIAVIYLGLGEVYTAAGQYKFAKDNYRKFLTLSGDNTSAKAMYAASLYKSGEFTEAIQVIDEVLALDPSRNFLNRLAAYSYYDRKLDKGVSKTPDYEMGIKYIEKFFNQTTPEKIIPQDYAYYGKLQIKLPQDSTNVDKGLDNIYKAYQTDTTDDKYLNEYIKSAYYNKRYDKSIAMINQKINSNTATQADYMMLGKAYYQKQDYKNAETVFNGLAEKDPNNIDAAVWQANTAASIDPDSKIGLAFPKYERVIQLASADSVKYTKELFDSYNYFASYYLFVKKDYSSAKDYAKKMVQLSGTNKDSNVKAYTFLGIIYTNTKEYSKAKEAYKKMLEFDPKNQNALKAIEGIDKVLNAAEKNK